MFRKIVLESVSAVFIKIFVDIGANLLYNDNMRRKVKFPKG